MNDSFQIEVISVVSGLSLITNLFNTGKSIKQAIRYHIPRRIYSQILLPFHFFYLTAEFAEAAGSRDNDETLQSLCVLCCEIFVCYRIYAIGYLDRTFLSVIE